MVKRCVLLVAAGCGANSSTPRDAEVPPSDALVVDMPVRMIDAGPQIVPSNSVVPMFPTAGMIVVTGGTATFDTDSGAITGVLTRNAGAGVDSGIGFQSQGGASAPMGVFSFSRLIVTSTGVVHFTGAAAAVFVSASTVTVDGAIDGSGGCYGATRSCGGPGGGTGGSFTVAATGCGAGARGVTDSPTGADSGGGGGAGGGNGAAGGTETASGVMFAGGAGGTACLAMTLEPLVGGSGGGAGGPGASATSNRGGGGGGAIQITAYDTITITGTLNFGGAGGMTGTTDVNNGGAGCGGGAGGGILIEAPTVAIDAGILAANGGGGGAGSDHLNLGGAGQFGQPSATPALGGAGINNSGPGGNGAAAAIAPTKGGDASSVNAGGGGGGVGAIYLRAAGAPTITNATISPAAGIGTIRTM